MGCISRLEAIRSTRPFAVVVEEASEVLEPLLFSCFCDSTVTWIFQLIWSKCVMVIKLLRRIFIHNTSYHQFVVPISAWRCSLRYFLIVDSHWTAIGFCVALQVKLEMIGDHLQLQPSIMQKFAFERISRGSWVCCANKRGSGGNVKQAKLLIIESY